MERSGPALIAAAGAAIYLAIEPHTVDFAAHIFRTDLFGREGFTIWNGQWYAGHHTPAYSLLFPPLAWLLGPALVGALSAVAAAALFEPLARGHFGRQARVGALWFGAATATLLLTGRLPFALGVAIGLGALLALQRGRSLLAGALAAACSLASPLAALFLALAGVAGTLSGRRGTEERRGGRGRRRGGAGSALAIAAVAPALLLSVAFPEGGREPFSLSAFLPLALFAAGCVLLLPPSQHGLRIGAALYGLGGSAAFLIQTPIGGNAVRLGSLFGGPLIACAFAGSSFPRRSLRALGVAAAVALAVWQWMPAARDLVRALRDPAADSGYYEPLLGYLEREAAAAERRPVGDPRAELGRVEVVFTKSHWEAAEIAPRFPLARGWQRQLDTDRNRLFYEGTLTERRYAGWLAEHAVRYVALPDAELDYSARQERALIERSPRYLTLRWSSEHWRVYEVTVPHALVGPEGEAEIALSRTSADALWLDVRRPGAAVVRVHSSPYWRARGACVEPAGEWLRVIASRPGRVRLGISFSLRRVLEHGRRCG